MADDPGLEVFYRLGVRAIGLTWNDPNLLLLGGTVKSGGGFDFFGRKA